MVMGPKRLFHPEEAMITSLGGVSWFFQVVIAFELVPMIREVRIPGHDRRSQTLLITSARTNHLLLDLPICNQFSSPVQFSSPSSVRPP